MGRSAIADWLVTLKKHKGHCWGIYFELILYLLLAFDIGKVRNLLVLKPYSTLCPSRQDIGSKLENATKKTKCWYVDTNFMSRQKSTISFLIFLPGNIGKKFKSLGAIRKFPSLPLLVFTPNHDQMQLLIDGFVRIEETLNYKTHSVTTVIGFMNLTNDVLDVQSPALSSGVVGTKVKWPTQVKPLTTETFITRKASYSVKVNVTFVYFYG